MKIEVADGKYTFVKNVDDWRVQVLRYGEDWITIENGHNAIVALMLQLEDYKKRLRGELNE